MFGNLGTTELLILALVVVVFFGGKKIPEFIRGIAEALQEFKKESSKED